MPRNMSFALTTEQFKCRAKTVTRRLGWSFLREGDQVMGVVKGMGLKRGEKIERLGLIAITSTRREPLEAITDDDVVREGFPGMMPAEFVAMFCKHNGCEPSTVVNRIVFSYVDDPRETLEP